MIGRRAKPSALEADRPKGFDDFELRLGDLMRGERATLSKSLLDVQRELRIKASYIAAIENADIAAFETPGFIAGYVRSYARYLGMDQDWAFARFCAEANFAPTHGMAAAASGPKPRRAAPSEPLADPNASFVPRAEAFWRKIEPRAVGSVLVLLALVSGLGYGGYSILQEVQRVQVAPVEQAPGMLALIDPLAAAGVSMAEADTAPALPTAEALDRLYRPRPLETPILVARDSPISAIDPRSAGVLVEAPPAVVPPAPVAAEDVAEVVVHTVAPDAPAVEILAVRPAWVRVQAADGTVILEKILDAGERFALPKLEEPPTLRTGESGAVYFAVNGTTYGPAGAPGAVTKNITLSPESLSSAYALADLARDGDLARMVALAAASN